VFHNAAYLNKFGITGGKKLFLQISMLGELVPKRFIHLQDELRRFQYHNAGCYIPFGCSLSSSLVELQAGIGVLVRMRHSVSQSKFEYALQGWDDVLETRRNFKRLYNRECPERNIL